ncbi:MAG: hypothetical protein WKI04_04040 [Ferruginibacter sp.]
MRKAVATAVISVSRPETITAIKDKKVPKAMYSNFHARLVYWG